MKTKKVKAIDVSQSDVVIAGGKEHPVGYITVGPDEVNIYCSDGWSTSVTGKTMITIKKR